MSNVLGGNTTKEAFSDFINTAAEAGEALADASTDWNDLTEEQQNALIAAQNYGEEIDILSEYFGVAGDSAEDASSKLKSFSDSLKGMVDQAQSLIDQIRGQRGLPGQGLEYYQGRFAQEQATLASALSAFQGDQTSDNLAALQRAFSRYMDIAGQYSQTTLDVLKSSPEAIAIQEMIANTTEQFQGQLMTVDDLMLQQLEIIAENTSVLTEESPTTVADSQNPSLSSADLSRLQSVLPRFKDVGAEWLAQYGSDTLFYSGGYTGNGTKYQPAGIVHKGEYVVPQSMSYLFPALEGIRRGYANGGGTIPVFPVANNMSYGSAELIAEIRALREENRRMNEKLSNIENNTGSTASYTKATAENPITASGLKRTLNRHEGAMA